MNNMKPTRYIRSLDGLRGIAVLAVIAYHLNFTWASGGLLGVTIFFVLSGYLITNLLLIEYERTNTINLKKFWIRRARRLLPGMLTVLLVITAWITLFSQPFLNRLQDDFLPAIFYYSNWWYIFQDLSYFEAMSTPSVLTHFWSLAIEEQFYIIWPLMLGFALIFKISKKYIVTLTLLLIVTSAFLMGYLYSPISDPSRVYYGTDTRAFSLLIGAVLAFVWPSQKLSKSIPVSLRKILDKIGIVCLLAIMIMMVFMNQYDSFLYRGGMLLASILTAVLLAVLIHPASKLSKFMTFKPLTWIGERSYGIYLWNYPIILLTSPSINATEPSIIRILVQIMLTFVLAALSYKYIENPIRKGAIGRFIQKLVRGRWSVKNMSHGQWFLVGCTALLLFVVVFGLTTGTKESSAKKTSTEISQASEDQAQEENIKENTEQNEEIAEEETPALAEEIPSEEQTPEEDGEKNIADYPINSFGDSVMVNVEPYLKEQFTNIQVNAEIGRQMYDVTELIATLKQNNSLGEYVIIALGTNGAFTAKQLSDVIASIGEDRQIFLINTRVPKNWESIVNERLQEAAENNDSVYLIDWYSVSSGHNEYFANDGVHLTKTGSKAYTEMIIAELQKH